MSELRLERSYPGVSPGRLFAFVTETDRLLQWWGPEGATATAVALDLTRPGPWSLVLESPRGAFEMRGTVLRVDAPRCVEFTMSVPGASPDSTVRFDIAPDGAGGCRFTLTQSGITDDMVAMGHRGWGSTLARLEHALGLTPG